MPTVALEDAMRYKGILYNDAVDDSGAITATEVTS